LRLLFFHRWVGAKNGGTETHVRELISRLSTRGHEIHVVTVDQGRLREVQNISVWGVSKSWRESVFSYEDPRVYFYTTLFLVKAFVKLISLKMRGLDFDAVSVHFASEAFLMRLMRRVLRWPYVFTLEGFTDLEAREARAADASVAVSKDIVAKCHERHNFLPLHVPIGVDRQRFFPRSKANGHSSRFRRDGENLLLCVCRLEPRKDLPTLISAMKEVLKHANARLLIVGDGILNESLNRLIRESELSQHVSINSRVADNDLPECYRAGDVFVLPTLYEGLGIVFLEAMSSEIPIVSTTVKAVPETVGAAAILVPPKDPQSLAQAILKVLNNEDLRMTLIERGREQIARYEWGPIIDKYEDVYRSVSESGES